MRRIFLLGLVAALAVGCFGCATQAAVLCALGAMDEAREAQTTAENLRARIQDYLEDAAQMKKEAELSRHEAERLQREVSELKRWKG